jgi:hypothetical protein
MYMHLRSNILYKKKLKKLKILSTHRVVLTSTTAARQSNQKIMHSITQLTITLTTTTTTYPLSLSPNIFSSLEKNTQNIIPHSMQIKRQRESDGTEKTE